MWYSHSHQTNPCVLPLVCASFVFRPRGSPCQDSWISWQSAAQASVKHDMNALMELLLVLLPSTGFPHLFIVALQRFLEAILVLASLALKQKESLLYYDTPSQFHPILHPFARNSWDITAPTGSIPRKVFANTSRPLPSAQLQACLASCCHGCHGWPPPAKNKCPALQFWREHHTAASQWHCLEQHTSFASWNREGRTNKKEGMWSQYRRTNTSGSLCNLRRPSPDLDSLQRVPEEEIYWKSGGQKFGNLTPQPNVYVTTAAFPLACKKNSWVKVEKRKPCPPVPE